MASESIDILPILLNEIQAIGDVLERRRVMELIFKLVRFERDRVTAWKPFRVVDAKLGVDKVMAGPRDWDPHKQRMYRDLNLVSSEIPSYYSCVRGDISADVPTFAHNYDDGRFSLGAWWERSGMCPFGHHP